VSAATREFQVHVEGLSVAYGDFLVQQDLNFRIRRSDVFIVMGPSGCGKTTVMRSLTGLLPPAAGRVLYGTEDLWTANEAERARLMRRNGVMYQSGALWSSLTLGENVGLPLEQYTDLSPRQIRDIAAYKLALVGLKGFDDFYPSQVSGGMQKRVGVARVMALDPDILYFDEPSAGLDPISARHLDDLILQLRDGLGTTMVVVTHELASLLAIGDDAVFLDAETKTMLATGNPRDLRDHCPDARVRAFLTRGEATPPPAPGAPRR
jgi:phospholipid/cholesterol/gamma-HCH transport system ATP-binding protein